MNACVDSQRQLDAATQPGINISPFITCKHLCTHLGPADGGLQSCDSACEACRGGGSVTVGLNAWMSEQLPGERVSSWSDRHARTSDWGSAVSEFYLPAINSHRIFCLSLPVHLEIQHKIEINNVSSGLRLGRFEFGVIIILFGNFQKIPDTHDNQCPQHWITWNKQGKVNELCERYWDRDVEIWGQYYAWWGSRCICVKFTVSLILPSTSSSVPEQLLWLRVFTRQTGGTAVQSWELQQVLVVWEAQREQDTVKKKRKYTRCVALKHALCCKWVWPVVVWKSTTGIEVTSVTQKHDVKKWLDCVVRMSEKHGWRWLNSSCY